MDSRRKWIIASIAPFAVVTVVHVAWYAASFEPSLWTAWLGLPYAVAVELAILLCAYFTKWQKTRAIAWVGYFSFVVASGVMNVGYIDPAGVAAWTYAIFPTLAISLLGFLYRQVDSLVAGKEGQKAQQEHKPTITEQRPIVPEIEPVVLEQLPPPFQLDPAQEKRLALVAERSSGEAFTVALGMEWAGLSRKQFYSLMSYGERAGNVQRVGRGMYRARVEQ